MKRLSIAKRAVCARSARVLLLPALALVLANCQLSQINREVAPTYANDYRHRHPIAIKEGERTIELFIGTNRGGLMGPQRADVLAFASTWRREATGGIVIDVPTGTPNSRAAHDAVKEVRALLHGAGVPPHGILTRSYTSADPLRVATMRLHFPKIVADAGPCGLWPHDLGPTSAPEHVRNRPYHNLGCANQRNLAAMVENPADLVQPRPEAPAYAARRSVVLDKYRKGEPTATMVQNPDKGTLSDVGK